MIPFLELLKMALLTVFTIFANPLFWMVIFLVAVQYRKLNKMRIRVLGKGSSLKDMIFSAIKAGLLGGIIGSILIMILGITIDASDFHFILPLAILLMLIDIRYICFSYSGGLLALSSLILGFPKLNVSSIIAIVAILHMIESILIYFDGYKYAMPMFVEDKRYGVVGAFTLQRFWPIPFTVLLLAIGPLQGGEEINLPNWWPLFKASIDVNNIPLQISCIVAALGYGDVARSTTPKEKSKTSAKRLFFYSLILLSLSIISTKVYFFKFIAALFAPLAHEYLIIYGQREEKKAIPIFRRHSMGVTVLDVENGVGNNIGLEPGDVIIKINNQLVSDPLDIQEVLKYYPPYIWIDVIDIKGNIRKLEYKDYKRGINSLGIVVVPKDSNVVFDLESSYSIIEKFLKRLFISKKNM
ncbi:PDZ domain-containing protein [Crassaminicella thermophila]|uniref:PDZ domain-containing protein n=1 Tax=Crassaminicella thermophila TaxID=2599308 RepID=A0A5C0SCU0_CRATE|nr:PDZ domain-containing protein [Crassaminicella thermophila]QEK11556.1 PDZ domain-containing protein [Crassaminicella thermophila]